MVIEKILNIMCTLCSNIVIVYVALPVFIVINKLSIFGNQQLSNDINEYRVFIFLLFHRLLILNFVIGLRKINNHY